MYNFSTLNFLFHTYLRMYCVKIVQHFALLCLMNAFRLSKAAKFSIALALLRKDVPSLKTQFLGKGTSFFEQSTELLKGS